MAKRYDVRFVLCEDIRVEANGKVSLAGIYPGELVVLLQNVPGAAQPSGVIAVLPRLCFVFFVNGPSGSVDVSIVVYGPDKKKKIIESKPAPSKVEQGKTATFGISGSTFPVPAIGIYTVQLKLGEELHELNFAIEAGPDFALGKKMTGVSTNKRSAGTKSKARPRHR